MAWTLTKAQSRANVEADRATARAAWSAAERLHGEDPEARAEFLTHAKILAGGTPTKPDGYSYVKAADLAGHKSNGSWQRLYFGVQAAVKLEKRLPEASEAARSAIEAGLAAINAAMDVSLNKLAETAKTVQKELTGKGILVGRTVKVRTDQETAEAFLSGVRTRLESAENGKLKNIPRYNYREAFSNVLAGKAPIWRMLPDAATVATEQAKVEAVDAIKAANSSETNPVPVAELVVAPPVKGKRKAA